MDVIFEADLSGYFLIVQDIVNYVREQGWLPGPGRGSAAGCLISYLIGITEIDPIEYDLIFERFYNAGRNTEDHVSLPDIDVDVPAEKRDDVIAYIKSKYGEDNVSQMLTFNKLQGRAALKEIMRITNAVSFAEMNDITKNIPNEADVSDLIEESGEKSLIRWTLLYQPSDLVKWCKVNQEGDLIGPLAEIFEQAIDIEGTIKSQGKHAAGVIISANKLREVCPMVQDRNKNLVAGFEMGDLEDQGHVKFDILGIDLLSKIMEIKDEH
jgi:DNA polymerase-3 subunit alpha